MAALLVAMLNGCAFFKNPSAIVPAMTIAAPSSTPHKRMVVVLPGRADDLASLQRSGIAALVQQHLPDADVVLVELTMAYYVEGRGMQRLHEQIVQPARQQGYREIYLVGASLGGMGALLYESEHPNEVTGLILMAPYMGEPSLIKEIQSAGGLALWDAGPVSVEVDRDSATRQEWRVVQSFLSNRARARQVWLVCGQRDQFHDAAQLIAQTLPMENYVELTGGHAWVVWMQGATNVFAQIGRETSTSAR